MSKDEWNDKIDKINEVEAEIQSLHDSIENDQADLQMKREN